MEIGTVYVAAPEGLTENCPARAPLYGVPTGGPCILPGSGGRSPLSVTNVDPIRTPIPVAPIGTGGKWGDNAADADTASPSTVHVTVSIVPKVGRKMPG